MKKTFLNLTLVSVLSLASCGGGGKSDKTPEVGDKKDKVEASKDEPKKGEEASKDAPEEAGKAVVTAKSGLSLRAEPNGTAKLVTLLPTNSIVKILEKGKETTIKGKTAAWYKVQYGEKEGYAFGGHLRMGDDVKATSSAKAATAGAEDAKTDYSDVLQKGLALAKSGLTMRSESNVKSKPVTVVPLYAEVGIIEFTEKNDKIDGLEGVWCKVRYGKKEGYVFNAHLCLSTATVIAKSGLKIRAKPMADQKELGVIPSDKDVYLLPPSSPEKSDDVFQNEKGETWYRVRYGKIEGWASGEFLAMEAGC